jgi:hypothetical protein
MCKFAEPQSVMSWTYLDGPADSLQQIRAEQRDKIRQHYTRNLREWPECNQGGKVELFYVIRTTVLGRTVVQSALLCGCCATPSVWWEMP